MIRYGCAYPDAVIERLASEVKDAGLAASLEPLGPLGEPADPGGLLAVELPADATDVLLSEAMAVAFAVLLDAAQRRHRRQRAAGETRDVAVVLQMPDDVRIVVATDASADRTHLLMTAIARRRTAGTLTAGDWRWDPAALCLERVPDVPPGS